MRNASGARLGLIAGLIIGVVACGGSSPTTQPFQVSVAVIHGHVSTAAGAPVVGASVRSIAYQNTCGVGAPAGSAGPTGTDSTGAYVQRLVGSTPAGAPVPVCVTVFAKPPPGSTLDTATVSGVQVTLKPLDEPPYDTVQVDIHFSGQ